MKIPLIRGLIDRRILVNYTIDPDVISAFLPEPFRPKIYNNKSIGGICLIRLKNIRLKGMPAFMGISSENGAHRIAVEWEENGKTKEGVFIPRRDTSLWINAFAGGRFFPGKHYLSKFNVSESGTDYHIDFMSTDRTTISVDARKTDTLNPNSIFKTLQNASDFFEKGSAGYSPGKKGYDGIRLRTDKWEMAPLEVLNVESSFFQNTSLFPKGSVQFDSALLMYSVGHQWEDCGCIR